MTKAAITNLNESVPGSATKRTIKVVPAKKGGTVATAPPPVTVPAGTTAAAIQAQASRLGISWDARPATVNSITPDPDAVSATYDGDSTSIQMVSVIGPVSNGTRVLALKVPPAGNFIIGLLGGATPRNLVQEVTGFGNTLTVTTASQALGSLGIAPINGSFYWEVYATGDWAMSVTGTTLVTMTLALSWQTSPTDGFIYGFTAASQRIVGSYFWSGYSSAPGGGLTATINTLKTANVGTIATSAANTKILVKIYQ